MYTHIGWSRLVSFFNQINDRYILVSVLSIYQQLNQSPLSWKWNQIYEIRENTTTFIKSLIIRKLFKSTMAWANSMVTFIISLKQQAQRHSSTTAHQNILHSENCLTKLSSWQFVLTELWNGIKPSNWRSSNSVTYRHCHRIKIPSCPVGGFSKLSYHCYLQSFVSYPQTLVFGLIFDIFCLFLVNVGVECNQRQIHITQKASDFRQMFIRIITIQGRFFVLVGFMSLCYSKNARTYRGTHKYQNINRTETINGSVFCILCIFGQYSAQLFDDIFVFHFVFISLSKR